MVAVESQLPRSTEKRRPGVSWVMRERLRWIALLEGTSWAKRYCVSTSTRGEGGDIASPPSEFTSTSSTSCRFVVVTEAARTTVVQAFGGTGDDTLFAGLAITDVFTTSVGYNSDRDIIKPCSKLNLPHLHV